jgi:HlyD family secretion protein
MMVLLIESYFFRYPDVVTAEMTLTGRHPVAQVGGRLNEEEQPVDGG